MLKLNTSIVTTDIEKNKKLIKEHKSKYKSNKTISEILLTTEKPHPKTVELSTLAQTDLLKAIETLKLVDLEALNKLMGYEGKITELEEAIFTTLQNDQQKVFISGWGAAGRAVVLVVKLLLEKYPNLTGRIVPIIAGIAGGESSLVKCEPGFEDKASFGIKHLIDAGWKPGDMFVGVSASGSAAFIHGQLEHVVKHGKQKPFFLYCNSNEEVAIKFSNSAIFSTAVRSSIYFVSMNVGEMALSGSTRMQAATVQIISIAIPLFNSAERLSRKMSINENDKTHNFNFILLMQAIIKQIQNSDLQKMLAHFIIEEATLYRKGDYINYITSANLGLTVLTDTTERSPTFNQHYFENDRSITKNERHSLCRIIVEGAKSPTEAWEMILNRQPKALNWSEEQTTSTKHLYGYDLSEKILDKRREYLKGNQHAFEINIVDHVLMFKLGMKEEKLSLDVLKQLPASFVELAEQVFLKNYYLIFTLL